MLKNLKASILLFLVISSIYVWETNAIRIALAPAPGCDARTNYWGGLKSLRLDSSFRGNAYLHEVNDGNHQKWDLLPEDGFYRLKNVATGLMLDSDHGGSIYTHAPNGGEFQKWRMLRGASVNRYAFQNVATGRRLDCHRNKAYTWPTNNHASQIWGVVWNA